MSEAPPAAQRLVPAPLRYGLAMVSVAAAVLIIGPLAHLLSTSALERLADAMPFLYAAVVISAWLGGIGPGLLAAVLADLAMDYILVPPFYAVTLGMALVARGAGFALSALLVGWLSVRRRRVEDALRRSRDELEVRVQERTADLTRSNEQLQAEAAERQRTEEALRESEHRYRHIFQTAGVSIWEEDFSRVKAAIDKLNDGGTRDFRQYLAAHPEFLRQALSMVKILDVNDATVTLFGARSKDELLASLHRVFLPETDEVFAGELIAIAEGRTSFESETVLRTLQGDKLAVLFTITFPQQPAKLDSVLVSITDITERRRAEEAVRRQANLLERTHDAILVWELSSTITYWNRGAEQLYGFSRKEAIGRRCHELLQTGLPMPASLFEAGLEGEGQWTGQLTHTTRAGRKITVESRMVLMREADDRRLVLEINRDITERRRAEEAVRRQANLLEQSHDAVLVWEFPGTITYWNRGAEHLYGFSREEAIGRLSHELLQTRHPMSRPLFEATLEREGQWTGELTHTTRDGRRIVLESRHVLMREADGRRLVLETNRDITERKQAEEALQKAQAELAHISRVTTMAEIAASIAHEINQPLAAVVSSGGACLRWLSGDPPNLAEARESATRIVRDGHRASEVVARVRALLQKSAPEKTRLEANAVIAEVMGLVHPEVVRHRVSVRTSLAEGLSPVLGDRVQLQQVLLNLIMNGIEAMSTVTGRPQELAITTAREESGGVRIAVQDSGIGLDPQMTDRLFDAFFTTKPAGLGMGLSISRSIIEAHGGRLWASPNTGPGATFQFTLPTGGESEA